MDEMESMDEGTRLAFSMFRNFEHHDVRPRVDEAASEKAKAKYYYDKIVREGRTSLFVHELYGAPTSAAHAQCDMELSPEDRDTEPGFHEERASVLFHEHVDHAKRYRYTCKHCSRASSLGLRTMNEHLMEKHGEVLREDDFGYVCWHSHNRSEVNKHVRGNDQCKRGGRCTHCVCMHTAMVFACKHLFVRHAETAATTKEQNRKIQAESRRVCKRIVDLYRVVFVQAFRRDTASMGAFHRTLMKRVYSGMVTDGAGQPFPELDDADDWGDVDCASGSRDARRRLTRPAMVALVRARAQGQKFKVKDSSTRWETVSGAMRSALDDHCIRSDTLCLPPDFFTVPIVY